MDSRDCLGLLRRWVGRLTLSWWDVALKSRAGGAGSTIRPSARSPAPNRRRSAKDRASDHLLPIETDDTFGQRVDAVGGFATTHVARLQREDGSNLAVTPKGVLDGLFGSAHSSMVRSAALCFRLVSRNADVPCGRVGRRPQPPLAQPRGLGGRASCSGDSEP